MFKEITTVNFVVANSKQELEDMVAYMRTLGVFYLIGYPNEISISGTGFKFAQTANA